MNIDKKNRPKYNIEDFRTWDNYDSDKKMLISINDEYCVNCGEFHIPTKDGKCSNCHASLQAVKLLEFQDNLKVMGVELKEVQHAYGYTGENWSDD